MGMLVPCSRLAPASVAADGLVKVHTHCKEQMIEVQAVPILKCPIDMFFPHASCSYLCSLLKSKDFGNHLAHSVRSTPNTQVWTSPRFFSREKSKFFYFSEHTSALDYTSGEVIELSQTLQGPNDREVSLLPQPRLYQTSDKTHLKGCASHTRWACISEINMSLCSVLQWFEVYKWLLGIRKNIHSYSIYGMVHLFPEFDSNSSKVNWTLSVTWEIKTWLTRWFFSPLSTCMWTVCLLHWEICSHSQRSFLFKKTKLGRGEEADLENKGNAALFVEFSAVQWMFSFC